MALVQASYIGLRQRRLDAERRGEQRSQQAVGVTAWYEFESAYGTEIDHEDVRVPEKHWAYISNKSGQVIYEVVMRGLDSTRTPIDDPIPQREGVLRENRYRSIPPGTSRMRISSINITPESEPFVDFAFKDARGVIWWRQAQGRLVELTDYTYRQFGKHADFYADNLQPVD